MADDITLAHHPAENRYELTVDGVLAGRVEYVEDDGVIDMQHTIVDPAFGGRGLGGRIVEYALTDARERGLRVVPTCSFISRFIDTHPDYQDLVTFGG